MPGPPWWPGSPVASTSAILTLCCPHVATLSTAVRRLLRAPYPGPQVSAGCALPLDPLRQSHQPWAAGTHLQPTSPGISPSETSDGNPAPSYPGPPECPFNTLTRGLGPVHSPLDSPGQRAQGPGPAGRGATTLPLGLGRSWVPSVAPRAPFRSHDAVTVLDPTLQAESRSLGTGRSLWVPCTAQGDHWTPGNEAHHHKHRHHGGHQSLFSAPIPEDSELQGWSLGGLSPCPRLDPATVSGSQPPGPGNQGSSALGLTAGSAGSPWGSGARARDPRYWPLHIRCWDVRARETGLGIQGYGAPGLEN